MGEVGGLWSEAWTGREAAGQRWQQTCKVEDAHGLLSETVKVEAAIPMRVDTQAMIGANQVEEKPRGPKTGGLKGDFEVLRNGKRR